MTPDASTGRKLSQMGTVNVYGYEEWDRGERRWKRAARLGTLDAIAGVNGIAMMSSEMVIDPSRVGGDGFVLAIESIAQTMAKSREDRA